METPCFECDAPATEAHHVIPRSRGGTRTVPLCSPCHGRVHGVRRSDDHARLTREGQERARAAGRHIGVIPFGYVKGEGGALRVDPQTAADIRRAFELLLTRSERQVAAEMGWKVSRTHKLTLQVERYVRDGVVTAEQAAATRVALARRRSVPTGHAVIECIQRARDDGATWEQVAEALNAGGAPSVRGGAWTASGARSAFARRAEYERETPSPPAVNP